MTQLLKPAKKLEPQFEYEVQKNGDIYVAGAKYCSLHKGNFILGNLFLDKLDAKNTKVWKPSLINPFVTESRKEPTRNSELYIFGGIIIAHSCWKGKPDYSLDQFVEDVGNGILQEYNARMDKCDLEQFFEKVHRHYMDFF